MTLLLDGGVPSDDMVAYHQARAAGGAGLIVTEASAVHPSTIAATSAGSTAPPVAPGCAVWLESTAVWTGQASMPSRYKTGTAAALPT